MSSHDANQQQWDAVTWVKRDDRSRAGVRATLRAAERDGAVEAVRRHTGNGAAGHAAAVDRDDLPTPKEVGRTKALSVQQRRTAVHKTQAEVAKRANVPLAAVQQYERGGSVPGAQRDAINRALGGFERAPL